MNICEANSWGGGRTVAWAEEDEESFLFFSDEGLSRLRVHGGDSVCPALV
jgi:hypothetical protein